MKLSSGLRIMAVLAATLAAVVAEAQSWQFAGSRPANVPSNFVFTPAGWFHPNCVIELRDDERLTLTDEIISTGGSRRSLLACGYPHFRKDGTKVSALAQPPQVNGWVADVSATTGPLSFLSAIWTVPANPTSVGDQTIYLFPGFEPRATWDTILQPVLGWNHYGAGPFWAIASWNCCRNGNTLHSPIVSVSSGATIYGYVWGTNCNASTGVCANWQVSTSAANGPQTTLNTDAYGEVLDWAVAAALEAYGVDSCAQYPGTPGGPPVQLQFTNVTVRDVSGVAVAPAFAPEIRAASPTCSSGANYSPGTSTATLSWCVPLCNVLRSGGPDGCGGTCPCMGSGNKCFDGSNWYYSGMCFIDGRCQKCPCE